MSARHFVIVGGGLAGAKTAEHLRTSGFDGRLTLLADEGVRPYIRPPLSKDLLLGKAEVAEIFVHPQSWYADNDVDLRLGVSAVELDDHTVTLSDGSSLQFDKLAMVTGSRPRRLDVPGDVHYLRRLADSQAISEVLQRGGRLAIVGGGWIGLEVAAAARQRGVDVTLVEAAPLPLLGPLGPRMAGFFADLHRGHGVDLRLGVGVQGFAGGVQLADGTVVQADAVVVGVGVVPNVELAQAAGLDIDNGIVVDEHLQTSHPDIVAAGDVANAWHPVLGRRIRVEHWANALNQPAVAAATMLGRDASYERLPYFYTDQYDVGMEYVGHPEGAEEIVIRGDETAGEFMAFWLKEGRVKAGMHVNTWDVIDELRELILSGREVDKARLADPATRLRDA